MCILRTPYAVYTCTSSLPSHYLEIDVLSLTFYVHIQYTCSSNLAKYVCIMQYFACAGDLEAPL